MERMTGILLKLVESTTLRYAAHAKLAFYVTEVDFELRHSEAGRRLYRLRVIRTAELQWMSQERMDREIAISQKHWSGQLQVSENLPQDLGPGADYAADLAIAREENQREPFIDHELIARLQWQILSALRGGASYLQSDKEGTTRIYFNGSHFMRVREGDDPEKTRFADDTQFLLALRNLFHWEARKLIYPHDPPEHEIWKHAAKYFGIPIR